MLLSVIIVNYKTPELLRNCLDSVYQETTGIDFEIIVVDNASGDNSRMLTLERFPEVKWIDMNYNAGFARANNEGIRQSSGDAVLLLNSDTIVVKKAIADCFRLFSSSHYVACGVQLLNADGTPQISGNYFMRGSLNNLLPLPYIGKTLKWVASLFNVRKPHVPEASGETEVDWINGAFLMVKKEATKKARLMDEDFFLYAEEAEWCHRLKQTGKLVVFGQFKVIHLQGETSNATFGSDSVGYYNLYDRKGLQIMLSNLVRIRKQYGSAWLFFHLLVYTLTIPVFFAGTLVRIIFSFRNQSAEFNRFCQFTRNVQRLWLLAPTISRNKPYFYKVL